MMLCFGLPPQQPLKKVEPPTGAHDTGWGGGVGIPEMVRSTSRKFTSLGTRRIMDVKLTVSEKRKEKKVTPNINQQRGLRNRELVCLFLLC